MTSPISVTPRTSVTAAPGYVTNTQAGGVTNSQWRAAALIILSQQFATAVGQDRVTFANRYGLDPNDPLTGVITNPETGVQTAYTSPATQLILSYYLDNYSGGDSYLDSVLPYVAPRSDEFVESPEQLASRVSMSIWEQEFGLQATQEERYARQQELDQQYRMTSLATQERISAASDAARIAAAQISAGATVEAAQISAAAARYGARLDWSASTYGTQEAARQQALSTAANLGTTLQQLGDDRVRTIVQQYANPIDMVAREYSTRALPNAPGGTKVAAYSDIPGLKELFERLATYEPTPAEMPKEGGY